jgi:hypothetical protein
MDGLTTAPTYYGRNSEKVIQKSPHAAFFRQLLPPAVSNQYRY